ncbi:putative transcription factor NIGTH1 [Cocos nucifera]|uniref:Putative transcription factor NIGTH1 n=1 Tax=Cocos nucifera TaxID=13894 RepID=A0A8K0IDJ6_COCNU|nr:putative transcription factor NIGTH1 [Cocos nucifera]
MGSTTPELGLDLKLYAMKSGSSFLKEASGIQNGEGRMVKLEECVKSLEEERRKIEAFKRELPLSMHLVCDGWSIFSSFSPFFFKIQREKWRGDGFDNAGTWFGFEALRHEEREQFPEGGLGDPERGRQDVIQGLKEELEQCRGDRCARSCHVLEEFMPVKSKFEEEGRVKLEDDTKDKMNWMSSAQLWSDNCSDENNNTNDEKRIVEKRGGEPDRETSSLESRGRSGGGAFVPFKGPSALAVNPMKEDKPAVAVPDLSLLSPGIKATRPVPAMIEDHRGGCLISKVAVRSPAPAPGSAVGAHLSLQAQQQSPRKARRCWSPELHRRFVAALQKLGGAQVATPKQIRELMKVDGLTNDEVKSHLQFWNFSSLVAVIQGLKEELEQCRGDRCARSCHVLEEFMPVKSKFEEEGRVKLEDDTKDKMNWMSSAQLWSDNCSDENNNTNDEKRIVEKRGGEPDRETSSLESRGRSGGGAFVPFKGPSALAVNPMKEDKPAVAVPDLSLLSPGIKATRPVPAMIEDHRGGCLISKVAVRSPAPAPGSAVGAHLSLQAQQQSPRKARRCWSPELHRRFVAALQKLGGAQVATPKQIRELMKVDGLTNDEVKSHLQKYRLHTRRVPNASAATNGSVVMMGGLWVSQEHYSTSKQSASQSGSPQSPLQLAGAARTISITAGDSWEEEDGKSESFSWK